MLRFAGTWLLLVSGGARPPPARCGLPAARRPDLVSHAMTLRGRTAGRPMRRWSRGAAFLTPPHDWGWRSAASCEPTATSSRSASQKPPDSGKWCRPAAQPHCRAAFRADGFLPGAPVIVAKEHGWRSGDTVGLRGPAQSSWRSRAHQPWRCVPVVRCLRPVSYPAGGHDGGAPGPGGRPRRPRPGPRDGEVRAGATGRRFPGPVLRPARPWPQRPQQRRVLEHEDLGR